MSKIRVLAVSFSIIGVLALGAAFLPPRSSSSPESIAAPYRFNAATWGLSTLAEEAREALSKDARTAGDEAGIVSNHFSAVQQLGRLQSQVAASPQTEKANLPQPAVSSKNAVEKVLRQQLQETLRGQGVLNPFGNIMGSFFPPLQFSLEQPPNLLLISPRDRIARVGEVILRPELGLEEMEALEARVDARGVASLVIPLGGYAGAYPTFVSDQSGVRAAIDTVAHEWLHQYLAFKPLGFAYVLHLTGVAPDPQIAIINETVASMFGREIAAAVYQRYYGGQGQSGRGPQVESVFNREIGSIRKSVDAYLAQGQVKQAEDFMEQSRQSLVSKGFQIRKLNQAYFAFYGTYGDSPASVSPVGTEVARLRRARTSLNDFLKAVSGITSLEQLRNTP